MRRLALDHITVVDTTPVQLVALAVATGCAGVCVFIAPIAVLPSMPQFDLVGDRSQRRAFKNALTAHTVAFDLAYPFTLTGRTCVADFAPMLECAADLGAGLVNALLYDRDPARRIDNFARFCDLAAEFRLKVGVEFYPPSQIPALANALELVRQIGRPGKVGINADLLHLMRSGGKLTDLAAAPAGSILYAQIADGPLQPPANTEHEAASQRMLAGAGGFDIAGFVRALPPDCPISIEIPQHGAMAMHNPLNRASRAVQSVRRAIG